MTQSGAHVLERQTQYAQRGHRRVAPLLRREMEERGLTAKELALQMKAWARSDPANRWAVEYRTIQNAADGTACALDTYLALSGFFGWDFVERLQTPIHGADPITAREIELAQQLAQVAALQNRVERARALRSEDAAVADFPAREPPPEGARAPRQTRTFADQPNPIRGA